MILLLSCLSLFITCFYIMSVVTGDFFKYLAGYIVGEQRRFYGIMSYVEVALIILTLFTCERGSQSMIFIFVLLGWLLSWAIFVPAYDMYSDKRKGYLFIWVAICIYSIITIININETYLWIKTI